MTEHKPAVPPNSVSFLLQHLSGFRSLGAFYLAVTIIELVVFALTLSDYDISRFLMASRNTPWGIMTSIFVHSDLSHLFFNQVSLGSFFVLFVLTNMHLPQPQQSSRATYFLISMVVSTFLANLVWIIVSDIGSIGASGLIYSSEGSLTGFSMLNSWKLIDEHRNKICKVQRWSLTINLLISAIVIGWFVISTGSFMSYNRDVNVLIHGSSFVFGLIIALESFNIRGLLEALKSVELKV